MNTDKILFLDIDGVLNSHDWWKRREHFPAFKQPDEWSMFTRCVWDIDPIALDRLERVVEETDCAIVISSSWRVLHSLDEIWESFDQSAQIHLQRGTLIERERIIGQTPDRRDTFRRGFEIRDWTDTHLFDSFAIVDDDSDMLDEQMHRFVHTSHEDGLQDHHVEQLVEILNGSA